MFCVLEQPKDLSLLTNSLQKLEISKPLDKKKDEYLKNIRSQKRKLHLHNKRLTAVDSLTSQLDNIHLQEDNFGQGIPLEDYINDCLEQNYTLEQVNELVRSLLSPNRYRQHFGAIGIRKLLSAENNPPIQAFIDAGIIPKLIEFLGKEDETRLQLEAAWSLSNLASGTSQQTEAVVDNGAIPELIKLLKSPHKEVHSQAVWTLGNIAGDNVHMRNLVLQGGAVEPLINIVERAISEGDMSLIRHGTWALANLCRGKPLPPSRFVKDMIPVFAKIIMGFEDLDVLIDAFSSISNLTNGDPDGRIQKVFDIGVVPFLVKHMNHRTLAVQVPCIKTVGNLFTGDDVQTDSLLAIPGVVENLFTALKHKKKLIRREAAWTLSNIAASTPEHLQHVIGNAACLDLLLELGINDTFEVKKEIAWVFTNAINGANQDQLRVLFDKKIIEYFGKIIEQEGLQELGLRGIKDVLGLAMWRAPEGFSSAFCWTLLEQNNIVASVEKLKNHANFEIAGLAQQILEYKNVEEEENQEEAQQIAWTF